MTNELLTREGNVFTGTVVLNDKGKSGYIEVAKCFRCGGAGGYKEWPGFTCFRCRGNGKEFPKFVRLYTADQLAKLNASQQKREAKKETARLAKVAAAEAVVNARRGDFMSLHGALIERARQFTSHNIIADLLQRAERDAKLSDKQIAFLTSLVEREEERTKAVATSAHVGNIGDRLETLVTVTNIASYERSAFSRFGAAEIVWIISMTDANGNVIVVKSPNALDALSENARLERGEQFVLRGTVKEHSEYKGLKQTIVQRVGRS